MSAVKTQEAARVANKLPPLTWPQQIQSWAYSIAGGALIGKGLVTGLFACLCIARYKFFGHVYSLSGWWQDWPTRINLPSLMSGVPIDGGQLGTWWVGRWSFIQSVYFHAWPIGVLGVSIAVLISMKGAASKTNYFDEWMLGLQELRPFGRLLRGSRLEDFRPFAWVPSQLQQYRTTPAQYIMLPFTMMAAGLFGALLASILLFGSVIAIENVPWLHGLLPLVPYIQNVTVVTVVLGLLSHFFWASRVVRKPAFDFVVYFLELRLSLVCITRDAMRHERNVDITPAEEAQAIIDATEAGRKAMPGKVFPPRFRQLVHRGIEMLCGPNYNAPAHSAAAKIVMPFYLVVSGLLTVAGLYVAFRWNSHGGYMW